MNDNASTCRRWLVENGHTETAELIKAVMDDWKRRGVQTRRNWWKILAGGKGGRPFTVNGREFPVLRAAQLRQGVPVTKNAIRTRRKESFPEIQIQERWRQSETSD